MKTKATFCLLLLCILHQGRSASLLRRKREVVEAEKRRVATKEILELEQELKQQAGENKKFFPSAEAPPLPQIDGLDDHQTANLDEAELDELQAAQGHPDLGTPFLDLPHEDESDEKEEDEEEEPILPSSSEEEDEEPDEEEEDDKDAFLNNLLDSLQAHPDVLDALMRGELDYLPYDDDEDEGEDSLEDEDQAIRAEMMSAMAEQRHKYAKPEPKYEEDEEEDDDTDTGATAGESEQPEFSDEEHEEDDNELTDDEADEDDEEDEEENDLMHLDPMYLKMLQNKRPLEDGYQDELEDLRQYWMEKGQRASQDRQNRNTAGQLWRFM